MVYSRVYEDRVYEDLKKCSKDELAYFLVKYDIMGKFCYSEVLFYRWQKASDKVLAKRKALNNRFLACRDRASLDKWYRAEELLDKEEERVQKIYNSIEKQRDLEG